MGTNGDEWDVLWARVVGCVIGSNGDEWDVLWVCVVGCVIGSMVRRVVVAGGAGMCWDDIVVGGVYVCQLWNTLAAAGGVVVGSNGDEWDVLWACVVGCVIISMVRRVVVAGGAGMCWGDIVVGGVYVCQLWP